MIILPILTTSVGWENVLFASPVSLLPAGLGSARKSCARCGFPVGILAGRRKARRLVLWASQQTHNNPENGRRRDTQNHRRVSVGRSAGMSINKNHDFYWDVAATWAEVQKRLGGGGGEGRGFWNTVANNMLATSTSFLWNSSEVYTLVGNCKNWYTGYWHDITPKRNRNTWPSPVSCLFYNMSESDVQCKKMWATCCSGVLSTVQPSSRFVSSTRMSLSSLYSLKGLSIVRGSDSLKHLLSRSSVF